MGLAIIKRTAGRRMGGLTLIELLLGKVRLPLSTGPRTVGVDKIRASRWMNGSDAGQCASEGRASALEPSERAIDGVLGPYDRIEIDA